MGSSENSLSFVDAAERILRQAGKPLTHKQLAQKALSEKLIATESETPDISMHVSIRGEMKRREMRGEPQRFVFLGKGLFSLVDLVTGTRPEKTKSALDQVRESRKEACEDLYKRLTSSNHGPDFETMIADLLVAMGYQDVQVIGGKDDQGGRYRLREAGWCPEDKDRHTVQVQGVQFKDRSEGHQHTP